ncbi:MAG: hypothetical protein CV089_00300 [Nitrospira sp. WS110]|nr:hypothetical protein [Nitrospira sp. WS110]
MPPGTVPPGNVPPGTVPPGTVPPGKVPPGTLPPGTVPPGTVPPGTDPPDTVPPLGVLSSPDSDGRSPGTSERAVSRALPLIVGWSTASAAAQGVNNTMMTDAPSTTTETNRDGSCTDQWVLLLPQ